MPISEAKDEDPASGQKASTADGVGLLRDRRECAGSSMGRSASFSGVVEEIAEERSRVKGAGVDAFGRATRSNWECGQVEKV